MCVVERIYTSFDGKEYQKDDALLLVDDGHFSWEFGSRGKVPKTAVKFATTNRGDVLYVGRAIHECTETPGAIYPDHRVLRIPFGGREVEFSAYQDINGYIGKKNQPFPKNILRVGTDLGDKPIYLGRVYHEGHKLPAKVIPVVQWILTSLDGKEFHKDDAFLLVDDGCFGWEFNKGGNVPETSIRIASTNQGDVLYVGRVIHQGSETPGVEVRDRVLRIPFACRQVEYSAYQVLCLN
ncbi:uncharacterized protein LOC125955609 [Anopheles darlingi]|uniref:uncharacterized protein LOC125955609 n=1 Tax=Anopheles darlingi TaxID=43151 RepID=UPI0021005A39|nr:uncharacterized protein LOC125955609 [Anopheles darlingi]